MQPYLSSEITEIGEESVVGVDVDMRSEVLAKVVGNLSGVDEELRFLGSENSVAEEDWKIKRQVLVDKRVIVLFPFLNI